MSDIYAVLLSDAEDLAHGAISELDKVATERQQIVNRLAEIEQFEKMARPIPSRIVQLREILARQDQALCPSCFLEGRPHSVMQPVAAGAPYDSWHCQPCGFHTSIPLRDLRYGSTAIAS